MLIHLHMSISNASENEYKGKQLELLPNTNLTQLKHINHTIKLRIWHFIHICVTCADRINLRFNSHPFEKHYELSIALGHS